MYVSNVFGPFSVDQMELTSCYKQYIAVNRILKEIRVLLKDVGN